jgi:hypothetical protein
MPIYSFKNHIKLTSGMLFLAFLRISPIVLAYL